MQRESELFGSRFATSLDDAADQGHDAVLVDVRSHESELPARVGGALVIPVRCRGELAAAEPPCLVGLRHALGSVALAGDLALRLDRGLGPGPNERPEHIEPELQDFAQRLSRLGRNVGDHETKLLLSKYGIEVTRQAVATTASAATRLAKRVGYPVDVKPWGPDVPTEAEGCPLVSGIESAADVRRAFASVAADSGQDVGASVIVRAAAPPGRELSVRFSSQGALGWMATAEVAGHPDLIAAPIPLSDHDASRIASMVSATRRGDVGVNTVSLADLLQRASYLAFEHQDRLAHLHLARIILTTDKRPALVVDASAQTTKPH